MHALRFLKIVLLLLALPMAQVARAEFTALCDAAHPCSVARPASAGVDSLVPVVWRGRALGRAGEPITSPGGIFLLTRDEMLGENAQMLSQPMGTVVTEEGAPFMFNEMVAVPAHISRQALAHGAREIIYMRRFITSHGAAATATQVIPLQQASPAGSRSPRAGSEPTASGVDIARITLRFDTGALVETIGRGDSLQVEARINYTRGGLLDAVWELATPATTRGQPVFMPLQNVRQYLGAGREITLQSPPLQSAEPGLYMVRLRLVQPINEREPTVLRYLVAEKSLASPARLDNLIAATPPVGALLTPDMEFVWQEEARAQAYQLEIYRHPGSTTEVLPASPRQPGQEPADRQTEIFDEPPVTGLLLASGNTRTALSLAVLNRLEPGRRYYWRVVAIDAQGTPVAASSLREIRVSP